MARKPAGLRELPLGLDAPSPPAQQGTDGHRHRMRERLLRAGPDALADYELLEMLLFLALPRRDTKPIAKALVERFGSFADAIAASEAELRSVEGMGDAAIAALRIVQAGALRLARARIAGQPLLSTWDRLEEYLTAALAREREEQFRVLFLNTRNHLLADEVMGRGTVNHAPVYPREVMRRALELKATALILVHNHPSGDPTPSRDDIEMTRELSTAARALGLAVHDHVIVGRGGCLSMRARGLL